MGCHDAPTTTLSNPFFSPSAGREGLPEEVLTGRAFLWSRHRPPLQGPIQKALQVVAGQVLLGQVLLSQPSQYLQQQDPLLICQTLEKHQAVFLIIVILKQVSRSNQIILANRNVGSK